MCTYYIDDTYVKIRSGYHGLLIEPRAILPNQFGCMPYRIWPIREHELPSPENRPSRFWCRIPKTDSENCMTPHRVISPNKVKKSQRVRQNLSVLACNATGTHRVICCGQNGCKADQITVTLVDFTLKQRRCVQGSFSCLSVFQSIDILQFDQLKFLKCIK